MSNIELTDTISMEFVAGLYYSKSGETINVSDIHRISFDLNPAGASSRVTILRNSGLPTVSFSLTDKDMATANKFGSMGRIISNSRYGGQMWIPVPDVHRDMIVGYLDLKDNKVHQIRERNEIIEVWYQNKSDTKPGAPPIYRVKVKSKTKQEWLGLLGYTSGIQESLIYVDKENYDAIVALATMPEGGGQVALPTSQPGGIHKTACSVTAIKIPRLTPTKYYDAETLKKFDEPTFAVKCDCSEGFFCDKVMIHILKGIDFRFWLDLVKPPKKGSIPTHFYLAVPMYNSILYSFRVKYSIEETWNGNEVARLMAYGISEDETFFYEDPDAGSYDPYDTLKPQLTITNDAIIHVDQVLQSVYELWRPQVAAMAYGGKIVPCKSKLHNYGTNMRIHQMLEQNPIGHWSERALILSLELYELCTFCYHNANPAFSLLPDLSS